MMIRNDDVAYDTDPAFLKAFCETCDKYDTKLIHAITPFGICRPIKGQWDDRKIVSSGGPHTLADNTDLLRLLLRRHYSGTHDEIAVHGLWHTHRPSAEHIELAADVLEYWGFRPRWFVPPFNEGVYPDVVGHRKHLVLCQLDVRKDRLEDYLDKGRPPGPITYLHSWRFDGSWHTLGQLDECLARIAATTS